MLIAGILMAAALGALMLAGRMRVPGLLLFLAIGMLIGSDGLGWIELANYEIARDIGIVALALILLEGGLSSNIDQVRSVARPAASLALVGTLLTALITGLAATWLLDLSLLHGLLLGSIIASTDVAAIFSMLRNSSLKPRITGMLEVETASNDPVAILLVIGFIEWITTQGYGIGDMALLFVNQLVIGAAAGLAIGWLTVRTLRAIELPTVGLYPVASLTAGGIAFGLADVLGGSGFLSIYITGLFLGGSVIPAKRTITAFHDGLGWIAQMTMFLTLGLLVFPSQLGSIAIEGTVLALILIAVSRPIASTAATALSKLSAAERLVLGWAGLRGAVPVVLATFPVIAGVPDSLEFFNIIFFAVVFSLVVQGPTFEPLARRVGLTSVRPVLPEPVAELGTVRRLGAEVVDYPVKEGDAVAGLPVRELGLPREAVVNVIVRDDEALPPRGSTRVEPGDHLHVLVRREVSDEVAELMGRWRHGPMGEPRRPRRTMRGADPVFTVRQFEPSAIEGTVSAPSEVLGTPVVSRLRTRRDRPGALLALEDGRYAITGPVIVIGSRNAITDYARRQLRELEGDERSWLQTVIGAIAIDAFR